MLDEVDPSGAAAGKDGQVFAFLDALDDLVALFHNGEVSGEVGVEDFVESESAETGDQFSGHRDARFESELLTDRDADSRSSLDDDSLGGIVDR